MIYKSIRLESLKESPNSFGSTHEREIGFTDTEWRARLSTLQYGTLRLPLIAYVDGIAVGLAWGVLHNVDSKSGHIYQMWVSPKYRGLGIGKKLLTRIIAWANERQLDSLSLTVTKTNTDAIALYNSLDFLLDGKAAPLRDGSALLVLSMQLQLRSSKLPLSS
jgi:ribosomal protein S18 acetylase RimI-like enzyme